MIRNTMADTHADVAAIAEVNTFWSAVQPYDRLFERTRGWFSALQISNAYAYDFPAASTNQAGGTAIFTMNDNVHFVMEKSADRWGRWCSTKFRGSRNMSFRVISAYRCVRNIHGPLSVWNQLRYLMDLQQRDGDPIECFDYDLSAFIQQCMSDGEQIILGIDVNADVRSSSFTKTMNNLGLFDICTHRHGINTPSTYARGSTPIDAIFVSSNLLHSKCGYLKVVSDHRVLWMDVPQHILFGQRLSTLPTRHPHRLALQDPRIASKYVASLESQLCEAGLLQRLRLIETQMETECTDSTIDAYNELDNIRTQSILRADKACRKLKMGQVPFSPPMVLAWNKIRAWTLVRRKLSGRRVKSRYLRRELKAAAIGDISTISLAESEEKLAAAWKHYKQLKKQASSLRANWIEGLAHARAESGHTHIAQELKNLLTRERQRNEARFIKQILQPNNRAGLNTIESQDALGRIVELTRQADIESALLEELEKRFNQASNTPFLQDHLFQDIGPLGVSEASRAILAGQYTPHNDVDEWATKLIPFLQQVIPTRLPRNLSRQEYIAGWKKVKERTSSGPSGVTIPHMKAHGQSEFLSEIDTILANLPYRHGFSPARWRKGLDVMIEKKPGARQLDSLRAILLYEADFNQNNKRLGREILSRAETSNAVAVEQYGSRKHMSASDQSLNKVLTFDIWRQARQRGALCCNDAKACYDRIVHSCASLCMQRVGTSPQPIVSMFQTIQSLEHHVRTVFGESKKFFKQTGPIPLQGVGQGNGAGPQIWALVSTPVLNMLRSNGLGATFVSALSRISTTLVGFAFVDDTDLVTSGPRMSLSEVQRRIQESLFAWEGGIRATGGAIEPRKSHWYLVDFDWKDGEPYYKQVSATGGVLQVRDLNGAIQTLKQLEPWEAERTLGVRIAPDGNMDIQFQWMLQTARAWTEKIRAGNLPRHLTWLAWRTTIQKTLEYPLSTTTLTRPQCEKLSSVLASVGLPRIGVLRSFPRALLHAPSKLAGLNVSNFYTEQGVAHILQLIRYSKSRKHSTGLLLRQTCEAMKLELGSNGFLLSNPWTLANLATDGWIKSTWQFAVEHDITVQDDLPEFQPIRLGDQLLIPLFLSLGYHGQALRYLNQCRLYLRVTWLSELVTADGRSFEKSALADPFLLAIREEFLYPSQMMPPAPAWKLWREALSRLCGQNNALHNPIGPFLRADSILWWFDTLSNRLYLDTGNGSFEIFRKSIGKGTRAESTKYIFSHETTNRPTNTIPATARRVGDFAYITGTGSLQIRNSPSPNPFNWILDSVQFPSNLQSELMNSSGELQAVSDGSFKAGHGTAAWMIVISPECVISGVSVSPGVAADQSAYRSELMGLYGIAMTVRHLEIHYKFCNGVVDIGCDGLSALNKASYDVDFSNPNEPHFDLITAIRQICQESSLTWLWRHIKGHQDDIRQLHELDQWSLWNIDRDKAAKQHWEITKGQNFGSQPLFGEPWPTVIDGIKLTSNLRQALRDKCNIAPALDYWNKKNRFGPFSAEMIDWESFGVAMLSSPMNRQHWISKSVSGFCSTGKMMVRRKERETDACPRCGNPEDVEHVWRCAHDTDELWNRALSDLQSWLDNSDSHPALSALIIEGLRQWRYGDTAVIAKFRVPWIRELARKQGECGWRNFFEGMLLRDWYDAIRDHFQTIHSKKSPRRWISALIRKMWQIAWDLWEHRNGFLHDKDTTIISIQTDAKIVQEFNIGAQHLDHATKALFRVGVQAVLSKPLDVKQQWLRRVDAARTNSALGNQNSFRSERQVMARWLGLQD
jgi:hypothetical protein